MSTKVNIKLHQPDKEVKEEIVFFEGKECKGIVPFISEKESDNLLIELYRI